MNLLYPGEEKHRPYLCLIMTSADLIYYKLLPLALLRLLSYLMKRTVKDFIQKTPAERPIKVRIIQVYIYIYYQIS